MATVFVVQEATRRDEATGQFVPVDISPAAEYGDIEILFPNSRALLTPWPHIEAARRKLCHFSDDDYLLPIGDMVNIMVAGALAAEFNRGRLKVLRWDGRINRYIPLVLNIKGA